jgi:hypothetical protein
MTIEQMDLLQSKLKSASEASHIWWGVSAENRKHGIPRVDHLRQAPARVRFLSAEPLLEDLGPISSGASDRAPDSDYPGMALLFLHVQNGIKSGALNLEHSLQIPPPG